MKSFVQPAGGIDWYCELRGAGPHVVLVPSGEGDCGSFAQTANLLAERFTVLTFDAPGFSRSGPPPNDSEICVLSLGNQIADLVRSLDIEQATFYGCSSGGVAVLDLLSDHSDIVRNGLIHEPSLIDARWPEQFAHLDALKNLDDETLRAVVAEVFAGEMVADRAAWEALGADYHQRLGTNFLTWVRKYFRIAVPTHDPARFMTRPLAWTVGAASPMAVNYGGLKTCEKAGIDWTVLPGKHFPQVDAPDILADHIADVSAPHID